MLARVGTVVFDLDALAAALTADALAAYSLAPLPSIYTARVRYAPPGDLATVREVLARGWGGCLSLAAARAGELLARGELARVATVPTPRGLHAVVVTPAGWEDPSALLTRSTP